MGANLASPLPGSRPVPIGQLPAVVREASGLAVSRRDPSLRWTHNDRGARPRLYALDSQGGLRGTVTVTGAGSHDWEDLATFELEGQAWILIADTGDNFLRRHNAVLYLIAEPDPAMLQDDARISVPLHARIPVKFPGGPQDCEGVAVDVVRREILLVSKRSSPPMIYRLPLVLEPDLARNAPAAEALVALSNLPQPRWWAMFNVGTGGLLRAWPTGLDISADGRTAVVLTYGEPYLFQRAAEEDWAAAFARPPRQLSPHGLPQAEAVAFSADARQILVTTEGAEAPLLRYELE